LNGNWLTRLPSSLELALILTVAGLAGFGLIRLQPLTATLSAIGAMVLITLISLFIAVPWADLVCVDHPRH
jgi:hypothetical protein